MSKTDDPQWQSPNLMVKAMFDDLHTLKLELDKVIKRLEAEWDGTMHSEQLRLLDRYELLQHTIDVHIKHSVRMIDAIQKINEVKNEFLATSATFN